MVNQKKERDRLARLFMRYREAPLCDYHRAALRFSRVYWSLKNADSGLRNAIVPCWSDAFYRSDVKDAIFTLRLIFRECKHCRPGSA